jgi:hypothetical protein
MVFLSSAAAMPLTIILNLPIGGLYDKDASPAFNATILPKLLQLYPDDPTVGSPYSPVGTSKSDRFYGPTNQYKRIASILGDTIFNAGAPSTAEVQHTLEF